MRWQTKVSLTCERERESKSVYVHKRASEL